MKRGDEGPEGEPEPEAEAEAQAREEADTASTEEGPRTMELELGVGLGLELGTSTGITEGAGVDDEHFSQWVTVVVIRGREMLNVWPAEVVNWGACHHVSCVHRYRP